MVAVEQPKKYLTDLYFVREHITNKSKIGIKTLTKRVHVNIALFNYLHHCLAQLLVSQLNE